MGRLVKLGIKAYTVGSLSHANLGVGCSWPSRQFGVAQWCLRFSSYGNSIYKLKIQTCI